MRVGRRALTLLGVNVLLAAGLTVAAASWDSHVRDFGGLQFTLADREPGSARPSLTERRRSIDLTVFDRHPEWPQRFVAASWTGYWYFPEPLTIDVYAGADDRVTVLIDEESVLTRNVEVGMETVMKTMRLGAGTHAVDVRFEQDGGGLGLNVQWAPSGLSPRSFDSAWLFPSPPTQAQRAAVDCASRLNTLAPAAWFFSALVWLGVAFGPKAWQRAQTMLPRERWALAALSVLAVLGVVWRILLVRGSPAPFGYVYDPYWVPVERFYRTGVLPVAADCWQCYHPPVFTLAGVPFFAIGMWLFGHDAARALTVFNLLATLCGLTCVYYTYRLLRWFRLPSRELVLATALALGVPFLFMSSYGTEADVLLSAIMTALLYHLTRYHAQPGRATAWRAAALGSLAGLAMATKYSGLVGIVVIGMVCALHLFTRGWRRAIRHGLIALAVCLAIGSWKYIDNARTHGTPLFANGSAAEGFTSGVTKRYWDRYDFTTFDLRGLLELTSPDAPESSLIYLPVYKSVWATLHGMAWGDMGFFTNPSRGGIDRVYVWRGIPPWLTSSVLLLGLLPSVLALAGAVVTLRRRSLLPLLLMSATTMAVYIHWFTAQREWALKTKYLLFLLPACLVYAMFGLRALKRLPVPGVYDVVFWTLVLLAVACQAYLYRFAIGA